MQKLKNTFNFYIFSNIHVAMATFCLTKITLLEIGVSENKTPLFVFFSTLVSYNLIRFLRVEKTINWFQNWFLKNEKYLYLLTGISLLFTIYFSFFLRLRAIFVLFPFAILTLFYVFPITRYSLRAIAGLKIFMIAISWAGITVLFPIIQNYIIPREIDYITFLQRFLFVIVITIPFDIRDLEADSSSLKTLPQVLGVNKSKYLSLVFLLVFFLLTFFKPINYSINIILVVITSLLLIKATTKQNKYYSAFYVEFLPIIWYLLIVFL